MLPHARRFTVLPVFPPGSTTLPLPRALTAGDDERSPIAGARRPRGDGVPWERPRLHRIERGRDFYIGDEHGRALVRVGDDDGRLHPDVELHLGGPFVEHELRGPPNRLRALVRTLAPGDAVYIVGRARLVPDRRCARLPRRPAHPLLRSFACAGSGPLAIYDDAAFRRLAAWAALPWYRKLSLMVRNR